MGEEAKQEQAKEEAKPEEKKEEPKTPSPLVLFVNLICVGCAKKIERSILKIRGVEGVVMDMAQNQVTIKGVVEPQAVCTMIMKKTNRVAKVISPLPEAEGEPLPEVVASQVSGLASVELTVNLHCEACAEQLKKKILQMKGVRTAETELSSGKVTVTGTMDADKLVDYVYRRTRKQAKIVPQPEPEPEPEPEKLPEEPKPEEKKEEDQKPEEEKKGAAAETAQKQEDTGKEEEKKEESKKDEEESMMSEEQRMHKMMFYYHEPLYVIEKIPPPQLFSDENPNACCIS